MDVDQILLETAGLHLGHSLEVHKVIGSTNDRVLELAAGGAPEGVVVCAESQSAGRGRLGRTWKDTPGGSLLFSVLLRPVTDQFAPGLLSIGAGVATADALHELVGAPVRTKWPNDLLIPSASPDGGPAKLGGILLEGRGGTFALGIGINITHAPPTEAPALPSISLDQVWQHAAPREMILAAILRALDAVYLELQRGCTGQVVARARTLDTVLGQAVTLQVAGESVTGIASGIDEAGALVIKTAAGIRSFTAGELSLSSGIHR